MNNKLFTASLFLDETVEWVIEGITRLNKCLSCMSDSEEKRLRIFLPGVSLLKVGSASFFHDLLKKNRKFKCEIKALPFVHENGCLRAEFNPILFYLKILAAHYTSLNCHRWEHHWHIPVHIRCWWNQENTYKKDNKCKRTYRLPTILVILKKIRCLARNKQPTKCWWRTLIFIYYSKHPHIITSETLGWKLVNKVTYI